MSTIRIASISGALIFTTALATLCVVAIATPDNVIPTGIVALASSAAGLFWIGYGAAYFVEHINRHTDQAVASLRAEIVEYGNDRANDGRLETMRRLAPDTRTPGARLGLVDPAPKN